MGQELIPGQVAWMSLLLEKAPLFAGQLAAVPFARGVFPGARAAKTEGARVARVVQRIVFIGALLDVIVVLLCLVWNSEVSMVGGLRDW